MNIIITDHHFELEQKEKNFINDKIQQKLQNFESRLHQINFIITQEHIDIKSECRITSDFGEFFASTVTNQFESSVDQTLTKIITEIKKKHDKIISHK